MRKYIFSTLIVSVALAMGINISLRSGSLNSTDIQLSNTEAGASLGEWWDRKDYVKAWKECSYQEILYVNVGNGVEIQYGEYKSGWQTFCKDVGVGAGVYSHCWDIPHVLCGPVMPDNSQR